MLQVVKVFVAAGSLLQFAQPAQGDDKWHAGASQKLKDGQGIVRT
ncbi:MAG: hypothetical protein ACLQNE_12360 [Thermoguttaceae bacterium]